jgi:hypothetical protein
VVWLVAGLPLACVIALIALLVVASRTETESGPVEARRVGIFTVPGR